MNKTRVVNKYKEKYDIYIGRGSMWGNPFVVGKDGSRDEVIRKYEDYARNNSKILKNIYKLEGKVLGCFCKPKACHGDILVKLVEEKKHTIKDCFYYFTEKYKEQTGQAYHYYTKRLGLELVKIKRLKLKYRVFINFIDWLFAKGKLSSINFLSGQLNDYYSSQEYKDSIELKKTVLHHKIMALRKNIVDSCKLCFGYGRVENGDECECLIKFMKLRDKIKKEFI